jgi:hypothetical protein
MKYLVLLILLMLHQSIIAQDIPKHANTIIVKGVSFDKVVRSLIDSGYIPDKMDKDLQYIKTEYKKICVKCVPEMLLTIKVKDSVATITGIWRSSVDMIFSSSQETRKMPMFLQLRTKKQQCQEKLLNQ